MYPIREGFLNVPFQYRLLNLADLSLKATSNYKKLISYFSGLNKKSLSIRAFVSSSDKNDNQLLNVFLFAQMADNKQIVCVNENLLRLGW